MKDCKWIPHFFNECDKLDKKCGWAKKFSKKLKKFKGLCPSCYIAEIQKINNTSRIFKNNDPDSISSSCDSIETYKTPMEKPKSHTMYAPNIDHIMDSSGAQPQPSISSNMPTKRKSSCFQQNMIPVGHYLDDYTNKQQTTVDFIFNGSPKMLKKANGGGVTSECKEGLEQYMNSVLSNNEEPFCLSNK